MIVVAGEALIDLVVGAHGQVTWAPGGGPYNVARTIGRLGGRVAFMGRLSTDRFGRLLRSMLGSDGVDVALTVTTEAPTTLALAELDDAGVASYRFYADGTAATGLLPGDLPATLPADVATVHVGSLGLALEPIASTLERLVGSLPQDVLVMADPNCRPAAIANADAYRARMARILARADLVKVSVDDLVFLVPGTTTSEAIDRLLGLGPRLVLVTDGPRPVTIATREGLARVPVPTIPIVDTVGAGDAFGAAFLYEWTTASRGRGELGVRGAVETATSFAIRVAALTCQRAGAEPPTAAEVQAANL